MKLEELKTIEQLIQFIDGTQSVIFKIDTKKEERYKWLQLMITTHHPTSTQVVFFRVKRCLSSV